MATLTNTQISVTYVGLLKTSANTVLSSTGQQITDGEGNNSILFLSTAGVGIGGAASSGKELDVTGNVLVTGDLQVDNINIDGNTISATSGVVTLANGAIATTQSQNDNSTKIATTAYVDTAIDGVDTLAEILAIGNTTGGSNISVSSGDAIILANNGRIKWTNDDVYIAGTTSGDNLSFVVGATELMNIAQTGGVTISTSLGVSTNLDVGGLITVGTNNTVLQNDKLIFNSSSGAAIGQGTAGTAIQFFTTNSSALDTLALTISGANSAFSGVVTANSGVVVDNITIDGNEIDLSSGSLTIDSAAQIILDGADDGAVQLRDDGTKYADIYSTSGDFYIKSTQSDKDIFFQGNDGGVGKTVLTLDMSEGGNATFAAAVNVLTNKIKIDADGTFGGTYGTIGFGGVTNGFNRVFGNVGTADGLFLAGATGRGVFIRVNGDSVDRASFTPDGNVTFTGTVNIGGNCELGANNINFADNGRARFGNSADLQVLHNGTDSQITNLSGNLQFTQLQDDGDITFATDNGSGGDTVYLTIDGGDENIQFSKDGKFLDGVKALFGNSSDLQIYHNGSNSFIQDTGTGGLVVATNLFELYNAAINEFMIVGTENGAVDLYHNGSKKLETTSTGAKVTGSNLNLFASSGATKLEFGQTNGNWKIEAGNSGNNTLIIGSISNATNNIILDTTNGGSATFSGNVLLNGTNQIHFVAQSGESNTEPFRITRSSDKMFFTYGDNAGDEAFYIESDGDVIFEEQVSIGTTTPFSTAKLQIKTATNVNLGFQTGTTEATGFKINAYNDAANANIPLELNGSVMLLKTGETERMRIDSSGVVKIEGSENTLLRLISTDANVFLELRDNNSSNGNFIGTIGNTMPFYTNNTLALTLDASQNATFAGNVNLADDKKLNFGAVPDFEIFHNSTSNVNTISSLLDRQLALRANTMFFTDQGATTAFMSIQDSGKVSVGNPAGTKKEFNVKNSGSNGGLRVEHSGSANTVAFLGQGGSGDEGVLFLQDSGTDTVKIAGETGVDSFINSGNLAIGTTQPSTFANFTNVTIQGGSSGSNLDFKNSSGTRVSAIVTTASNELIIETGTAQPIIYKTNDTERMRITSGGEIGIGTTSVSAKVQIHSTNAGQPTIPLFIVNKSTDLNTEARLGFAAHTNDDVGTNRYSYISTINTSGSNGQDMIFATNPTGSAASERMRIRSDGAINLGTIKPIGHNLTNGTINNGASVTHNANTAGGNQAAGFLVVSAVPNNVTAGGAVGIFTHIHTQGANVYSQLSKREENNITISESGGVFTISNSSGSTVHYQIKTINMTDFDSTINGY